MHGSRLPTLFGSVRSCVFSNSISLGKRFRCLKKSLKCIRMAVCVAGHPIPERASAAIESDELASAAGLRLPFRIKQPCSAQPQQVVGLSANLLALPCLILTFGSLRSGCITFAARSSCAAKHVASRLPERQWKHRSGRLPGQSGGPNRLRHMEKRNVET